ncbi:MAG: cytochrome c3 family protein [Phycisphaerae bacterium]|nr:cytochrome c3 family protein [Phycisphaerae bacterium]
MSHKMTILGLMTVAALALSSAAQAHPSKCSSCHIPHKAALETDPKAGYGVPLWTTIGPTPPKITGAYSTLLITFNLYTSPRFADLATDISQPDGPSKLCLGCHDGYTSSVGFNNTGVGSGTNVTNTLSESHPISFTYDTALTTNTKLRVAGELKDPATALSGVTPAGTVATDLLDSHGKLQCTSCHDIHSTNTRENFLRFDFAADNGKTMCRTCHAK